MSFGIGSRLGVYEIVALLGVGGMGEVYRARDTRLGREVAVKVIPDTFADDPERLERFEREARTIAALNHPGIVTLHSIEAVGRARFLTMELVEGDTLDRAVTPGGLPTGRLLDLAIPFAEALSFAHDRGVVHRDLKPSNVMVTAEGWVKVLDFGLARVTQPGIASGEDVASGLVTQLTLSQPGVVMGTPAYMAPEQLRGEPLDARADLFALGIILYELAAGRHPFYASSVVEVTSAILRDTPPSLSVARPDLPKPIVEIIARCLEKERDRRVPTARAVLEELKSAPRVASGVGRVSPATTGPTYSSIAVLPFANNSGSTEDEYFSDGLADQLINLLARIRGLRVAARTSAFRFKNLPVSIPEIGAKLNVEAILEGSVRKSGDRVRASVQLVNVSDGYSLWSETFDRAMDDIFAVQDDIAERVVFELKARLAGDLQALAPGDAHRGEVARAAVGRGTSVEAHRLVLLARHHLARYTRDDTRRAKEHLGRALELDDRSAAAWVEMSRAWSREAHFGWSPVAEGSARAREAAERALALVPELPEAHAELGRIRTNFDWDWLGAESALRRALALGPGVAAIHQLAGSLAYALGRLDEAIGHCRHATELDVLSAPAHHTLGSAFRAANRLTESEAAYRKALELSPQKVGVHADLALVLDASGLAAKALEEVALEPLDVLRDWALAIIHAEHGRRAESDEALRRLTQDNAADCAYQIAVVHAVRGEFVLTREWLERAYAQRDGGLLEVNVSPGLELFRADPLGREFLRKMKFIET